MKKSISIILGSLFLVASASAAQLATVESLAYKSKLIAMQQNCSVVGDISLNNVRVLHKGGIQKKLQKAVEAKGGNSLVVEDLKEIPNYKRGSKFTVKGIAYDCGSSVLAMYKNK